MKRSFRKSLVTRRIRLKRHSGDMYRDLKSGLLLVGTVGLLTFLAVAAYFLLTASSYFKIESTVVNGCGKVSAKEVLALSELKPDQRLLYLNAGKIVRKIKANPWIEDVAIRRELPGKLIIEVKERQAVALMRKDQTLYFVDAGANPFKKIGEQESAELPILTGFSENGVDKTEMIRKSLDLLAFFSRYEGFPRLDNISEVHGDETFGFTIFADNGISIQLGYGNYEDKLKRLKLIMADLVRRDMPGFFNIDLSNPAKVIVQRKDAPQYPKFSKGYRT